MYIEKSMRSIIIRDYYMTFSISALVLARDSHINKGNNKITELRAILQRESQNS